MVDEKTSGGDGGDDRAPEPQSFDDRVQRVVEQIYKLVSRSTTNVRQVIVTSFNKSSLCVGIISFKNR